MNSIPTTAVSRRRRHSPWLLTLLRSPFKVVRFFFSRRTPLAPKLLSLLAVAYVVWPVDLIPDVAPLLGWLDDAGVVSLAMAWVFKKVAEMDEAPAELGPSDQTAALTSS